MKSVSLVSTYSMCLWWQVCPSFQPTVCVFDDKCVPHFNLQYVSLMTSVSLISTYSMCLWWQVCPSFQPTVCVFDDKCVPHFNLQYVSLMTSVPLISTYSMCLWWQVCPSFQPQYVPLINTLLSPLFLLCFLLHQNTWQWCFYIISLNFAFVVINIVFVFISQAFNQ